jgi:hypothetical protein
VPRCCLLVLDRRSNPVLDEVAWGSQLALGRERRVSTPGATIAHPHPGVAGVHLSRGQGRAEMHTAAGGLGVDDACPRSRGSQVPDALPGPGVTGHACKTGRIKQALRLLRVTPRWSVVLRSP